MANYVMLFHWTHQGIDHVKAVPERIGAAKQLFAKHGAKVKELFMMMGQYDSMFVVEAPDDDTVATAALAIGALGNVRTETHRAWSEADIKKIIAKV
jgi:uncharacterized protein with GYD domain